MWVYIIKCLSFIFLINLFITYSSLGQNINQALSLAYSNHPLLFAERAAGRAASENVTEALSDWRPEVHLDSSIGKKLVTSKLNGGSANTKNINLIKPKDLDKLFSKLMLNKRFVNQTKKSKIRQ